MVELVRWPSEARRRDELAAACIPRLLLVSADAAPPRELLGVEDWIRVPADERDLFVRIARLDARHRLDTAPRPVLDELVLRNEDRSVVLSPLEAAIVQPLLEQFGELVLRDAIIAAAWGDGIERSLSSHIRDLRVRLATVDLQLLTIRSRGFVLEHADPGEEWIVE